MDNPVIILGAGAIGRAAMEIFESNGVLIYGFLDDNKALHGTEIGEVSVLGNIENEAITKNIGKDCEAFVAVDENELRKNIVSILNKDRNVMPVNAIHTNAYLAESAQINHGIFINSGVVINGDTKIGNHCMIHSNTTIDQMCVLGEFIQVGVGSNINSGCTIEDEVFIGSGVTIVSGITIGKGARIGAGSVVVENVASGSTIFGNPAKPIG